MFVGKEKGGAGGQIAGYLPLFVPFSYLVKVFLAEHMAD